MSLKTATAGGRSAEQRITVSAASQLSIPGHRHGVESRTSHSRLWKEILPPGWEVVP